MMFGILLAASCPAFAEPASAPVLTSPAVIANATSTPTESGASSASAARSESQGFPLTVKGTEIFITSKTNREELSTKLQKLLGEITPMENKNRLQFDYQADPDEAPLTVIFDWDLKGNLAEIVLDAFAEKQNKPGKDLKDWLTKNVGPGKANKSKPEIKENLTWEYNGWSFHFQDGNDGEESVYAFHIKPLKSK